MIGMNVMQMPVLPTDHSVEIFIEFYNIKMVLRPQSRDNQLCQGTRPRANFQNPNGRFFVFFPVAKQYFGEIPGQIL